MIREVVLMRLPQFKGFLKSEKMKKVYLIADSLTSNEMETISQYHDGKDGFFVPFFRKDNDQDNLLIVIVGDKFATLVGVMKGIDSLMSCKECIDENEGGIEVTTDFIKEVDKEGIEELFKIYFPESFDKFNW